MSRRPTSSTQPDGDPADGADREHADEDVGIVDDRVGLPGAVAEAEVAGDHLGRDHADPGDAHADGEPAEDPGHDAGQDDVPSTRRRLAPMVSSASSHTVGRARTACRVLTRIGKNAAVAVMKTMPCSLRREQQDRHRHQRDRRDRPGDLQQRLEDVGHPARAGQQDAEPDPEHGGEREAGEDPDQALGQVLVVERGPELQPERLEHLDRPGDPVEAQPEHDVPLGEQVPEQHRGGQRAPAGPPSAAASTAARPSAGTRGRWTGETASTAGGGSLLEGRHRAASTASTQVSSRVPGWPPAYSSADSRVANGSSVVAVLEPDHPVGEPAGAGRRVGDVRRPQPAALGLDLPRRCAAGRRGRRPGGCRPRPGPRPRRRAPGRPPSCRRPRRCP